MGEEQGSTNGHWVPPADARDQDTGRWRMPTDQECWAMVAGSERLLRREVRRVVPRSMMWSFEYIYSDCVTARVLSIMATFDPWHPKRAGWLTHFVANARWYAYKRVHGKNGHWQDIKRDQVGGTLGEHCLAYGLATRRVRACDLEVSRSPSAMSEQERRALLGDLLALVEPAQADLVRWRLVEGFDYDEIASHLGVSRARARRLCGDAQAALEEAVWRDSAPGRFAREVCDLLTADGV